MGCIHSTETGGKQRSEAIDKQIQADAARVANEVKLLLLGAGESGKSTIVKQMKIIHEKGYTVDECLEYRLVVYRNVVQSLTAIVRAMGHLMIPLEKQERVHDVKRLFELAKVFDDTNEFPYELCPVIKSLWSDNGIRECFQRSREYQLNDSAP
jgi:guanine nucleotide-binding protein G(i) subunit alpha